MVVTDRADFPLVLVEPSHQCAQLGGGIPAAAPPPAAERTHARAHRWRVRPEQARPAKRPDEGCSEQHAEPRQRDECEIERPPPRRFEHRNALSAADRVGQDRTRLGRWKMMEGGKQRPKTPESRRYRARIDRNVVDARSPVWEEVGQHNGDAEVTPEPGPGTAGPGAQVYDPWRRSVPYRTAQQWRGGRVGAPESQRERQKVGQRIAQRRRAPG